MHRPWFAAIFALAFAALSLCAASPASAQLGPGDLQRAHALTANSAGWVALRAAMHRVVKAANVGSGDPQETADTLAVLLALEDGDGALDAVLIGSVRAAIMAQATKDRAISELFSDQGLTLARAHAIACLIFGQAPDRRASIAEVLKLTENDIAACPDAYAAFRDHWLKIAAPLRKSDPGEPQIGDVELIPAGGSMASARAVLIAGRTIDEVSAFFVRSINTPTRIRFRAVDCEIAPAPAVDEVRLCYQLVGEIASGVERGIVAER